MNFRPTGGEGRNSRHAIISLFSNFICTHIYVQYMYIQYMYIRLYMEVIHIQNNGSRNDHRSDAPK